MSRFASCFSLLLLAVAVVPRASLAARDPVAKALAARKAGLVKLLAKQGLSYPPREVYLRVFKREGALEVWARERGHFALVRSYPICAASGDLGPKRRSGDLQVPEGFYVVDRFNPWSAYHLSLGINYPNASDRKLGYKASLGGDIFLHGKCASIGCVAITDGPIEDVYLLADGAHRRGQARIPVHIFPTRLDAKGIAWLEQEHSSKRALLDFWASLRPAYELFEKSRAVPRTSVDVRGRYHVLPAEAVATRR